MDQVARPRFSARDAGQINGDNIIFLEPCPRGLAHLIPTDQIDFQHSCIQLITDPTSPFQKIRVFARKSDQAKYILHHGLADTIHKWRKLLTIGPKIFLGDYERFGIGKTSVKLDNARP